MTAEVTKHPNPGDWVQQLATLEQAMTIIAERCPHDVIALLNSDRTFAPITAQRHALLRPLLFSQAAQGDMNMSSLIQAAKYGARAVPEAASCHAFDLQQLHHLSVALQTGQYGRILSPVNAYLPKEAENRELVPKPIFEEEAATAVNAAAAIIGDLERNGAEVLAREHARKRDMLFAGIKQGHAMDTMLAPVDQLPIFMRGLERGARQNLLSAARHEGAALAHKPPLVGGVATAPRTRLQAASTQVPPGCAR